MPPASFIASVAGVWSAGPKQYSFLIPSTVKPGDSMLIVSLHQTSLTVPTGWSLVVNDTSADFAIVIMRREVTESEGAAVVVTYGGPSGSNYPAVLLVYRGLNGAQLAPIASSFANVVGSVTFPCPSRTLTTYSDLFLGICQATIAGRTFTPPAGATERFDTDVEVFDLFPEAVGATGSKDATASAASQGTALSLIFAAGPVQIAPSIVPDVPGAIGLVTVGV